MRLDIERSGGEPAMDCRPRHAFESRELIAILGPDCGRDDAFVDGQRAQSIGRGFCVAERDRRGAIGSDDVGEHAGIANEPRARARQIPGEHGGHRDDERHDARQDAEKGQLPCQRKPGVPGDDSRQPGAMQVEAPHRDGDRAGSAADLALADDVRARRTCLGFPAPRRRDLNVHELFEHIAPTARATPQAVRRTCACGESGKRGATAQPWPRIANVREKRGVDSDLGRLSDTCADKLDNGACPRHGASPKEARPVSLTLTFDLYPLTFDLSTSRPCPGRRGHGRRPVPSSPRGSRRRGLRSSAAATRSTRRSAARCERPSPDR